MDQLLESSGARMFGLIKKKSNPGLGRERFGLFHMLWLLVFFGIPLLLLIFNSLKKYEYGQFKPGLTIDNYKNLLFDSPFPGALYITLILALTVSLLSTLIALGTIISAWLLSKKVRNAILLGCTLVFFAGVTQRAFALEFVFSDRGLLGLLLQHPDGSTSLLYSNAGVVLAYLPILLPLCIAVLYVARKEVSTIFEDAAVDLGAEWQSVQIRVVIPLMKPGIIVSLILPFILVVGDVVVVDLIGGAQVFTSAMQIIDYTKIDDWGTGGAASVILLLVIGLIIWAGSTIGLGKRTGEQ